MAWFARSFSMKEEPQVDSDGEEDEDEVGEREEGKGLDLAAIASATGASVKEDLSNLTKTFTRQLWGVASFLAPPAPEKSSSVESLTLGSGEGSREGLDEGQKSRDDEGILRSSSGANEIESPSGRGFIKPRPIVETGVPETESYVPATVEATLSDVADGAYGYHGLSRNSGEEISARGPRLTGLRSDFAELRGSVATGFSRISSSVIRVVTGDDSSASEEEELSSLFLRESSSLPPGSVENDRQIESPRRGLDAFLEPLFGSRPAREREAAIASSERNLLSEDHDGDVDARISHGEGESKYRELDLSLPSAIASGIVGISKFASVLLRMVDDDDDEGDDQADTVGITEAVLTFASNIAMHPETWLDFPLTEDEPDGEFELTAVQKEHAHALEIAAPALKALKIELCPQYMTEERFWKIYFVLTHSRLSSKEARLLSTQQVVRARASMIQEIQKKDPQTVGPDGGEDESLPSSMDKFGLGKGSERDFKKDEEDFIAKSSQFIKSAYSAATMNTLNSSFLEDTRPAREANQSVGAIRASEDVEDPISEYARSRFAMLNLEEDETEADSWLDEESSTRLLNPSEGHGHVNMNDMAEDVSFSDLEEDDPSQQPSGTHDMNSSSNYTNFHDRDLDSPSTTPPVNRQGDGTPPKSSERGEFNDWLTVDQDDVASASSSP